MPSKLKTTFSQIKKNKTLYLMIFPVLIYFFVFRLLPILNLRLAFFDYDSKGPWLWAGLKYFKLVFDSSAIFSIINNTLIISFMKYVFLFPFTVLFAILLNEIYSSKFRNYLQVVSYLPHFLSWVVIAGIWIYALNPTDGIVNQVLNIFNLPSQDFMTDKGTIRWVLVFSEAWRSIGWDSIIFYTAILSISPSLYDAAAIDGANRFTIIKSIILPALVTPIITVLILNLGFFMSAGFDQVFNFTNDSVNSVIDILDTYIYRMGLDNGQYSIASAVSLIKGLIGMLLVFSTHKISKKITGKGVW